MGGNGALALGIKRPDLYNTVVDLSGGIGCSVDTDFFIEEVRTLKLKRLQGAFGDSDSLRNSEYDLGNILWKHLETGTKLPGIFMAVGKQDFILDVVRRDKAALESMGVNIHCVPMQSNQIPRFKRKCKSKIKLFICSAAFSSQSVPRTIKRIRTG